MADLIHWMVFLSGVEWNHTWLVRSWEASTNELERTQVRTANWAIWRWGLVLLTWTSEQLPSLTNWGNGWRLPINSGNGFTLRQGTSYTKSKTTQHKSTTHCHPVTGIFVHHLVHRDPMPSDSCYAMIKQALHFHVQVVLQDAMGHQEKEICFEHFDRPLQMNVNMDQEAKCYLQFLIHKAEEAMWLPGSKTLNSLRWLELLARQCQGDISYACWKV